MLTTFLCTLRIQLRRPSMLVWVFAFPVVLSTIFLFMFSNLSTDGVPDPVRVAVVADDAWNGSTFSQVVDALATDGDAPAPETASTAGSGGGSAGTAASASATADSGVKKDALLEVHRAQDEYVARALLERGDVVGILSVDAQGTPALALRSSSPAGLSSAAFEADRSILDAVASSYVQNAALVKEVAASNPSALADASALTRALGLSSGVERVRLTHGTPDETVRYYYALLGMAALMAAQSAAMALGQLQPTEGGLGARICASGTSRVRQVAGALLGSWAVSLLGLGLAFAFMRFVAGIDFGGRDALCLLGLATSSLLSTAIGAVVGVLPLRGGIKAKVGLLTAFSCLMSLFAGLYGEGAMQLSDSLARSFPASVWINPARLITDQFYALYYYDSLAPFALRAAACCAASVALLAAACGITLRRSHEHL